MDDRDLFRRHSTDDDSDAPEEVGLELVKKEAYKLRKNEKESRMRISAEAKRKRKLRSTKNTENTELNMKLPKIDSATMEDNKLPDKVEREQISASEGVEGETNLRRAKQFGMLPESIVNFLAEREKDLCNSPEGTDGKDSSLSKRMKKKFKTDEEIAETNSMVQVVNLSDTSKSDQLLNAKEFLQKRQSRIQRSSSVLNNARRAFPLLFKQGVLH
eukprot:TRINITY_DN7387_c0_g1_i1.p1 TRINITY_DN7387_c0_g1~~TRINITY_DN7387_c0_g1_i1.p1  ORF type:complete len:216 (-),score=58.04 TRINITY_DN7387_c0_g1_i1:443-1090(-)